MIQKLECQKLEWEPVEPQEAAMSLVARALSEGGSDEDLGKIGVGHVADLPFYEHLRLHLLGLVPPPKKSAPVVVIEGALPFVDDTRIKILLPDAGTFLWAETPSEAQREEAVRSRRGGSSVLRKLWTEGETLAALAEALQHRQELTGEGMHLLLEAA